jgi:hypothetical protein
MDTAGLADATAIEDSVAAQDTDAAAAGGDVATDSAADAAAEVTPAAPWTATGKLVEVSELLEGPLAVDPGSKAKTEPASSGALAWDVDGDQTADLAVHDGVSKVWLYRSLKGKSWKWQREAVGQQPFPGLRSIALHQDPGLPPALVVASARPYYMVYQKQLGQWISESEVRGLKIPPNLVVQSIQPADVDEDGLLDLVMTIFTCDSNSRLLVFVNQGQGVFSEQGTALGLQHAAALWNTLHTDIDGDGHADLLTLSEDCQPKAGNGYFRNLGHPSSGPRYAPATLPPVFLAPKHGGGSPMGAGIADFDGNGTLDLALSDIGLRDARRAGLDLRTATPQQLRSHAVGSNQLLLRGLQNQWMPFAVEAGITAALSSTGLSMVSWTALPWDIDADGRIDLLLTHGWDFGAFLLSDEGGARPVLFRNLGNGQFTDMSAVVGLPDPQVGRNATLYDVDDDGDLDLFLGGQAGQPRLYRNDLSHGGHTLRVRLRGSLSNLWGLGARLDLLTTDGKQRTAELTVHAASHGMAAAEAHFGWPASTQPLQLMVTWPSGVQQRVQPSSWPLDGGTLLVEEPPVVAVTERKVQSKAGTTVQVRARRFDLDAKPLPPTGLTIELGSGGGSWLGPLVCDAVQCVRDWQPPVAQSGETAFVVSVDAKAWRVRPRVRYSP